MEHRTEKRVFLLDDVNTSVDGGFTGEVTVGVDTPLVELNLRTRAFAKTIKEHKKFPILAGKGSDPVGTVSLAAKDDGCFSVRGEVDLSTMVGRDYHALLSTWSSWEMVAEIDVMSTEKRTVPYMKGVKGDVEQRTDVRLNSLLLRTTL